MWQILLAHPNYETGGARQSAVAAQPMHVWRVCQLKSGFKYPDHSNNCTFSPVRAILKPQEASKVKFACFKGIVHPTHFQKQVGWGTWLHTYRLKWTALQNRHTFHKQLVYWHLQGDTRFSLLGNNCLNWTWDGVGFTVVPNVRHLEHPEIPYLNTSSLEIS